MRIAVSTGIGCDGSLDLALDRIAAVGCPLVDILTIDGWVHVLPSSLVEDFEGQCAAFSQALSLRGLQAVASNSGLGVQLHDRSPEAQVLREARQAALFAFLKRFNAGFCAIQPLQPDRERDWEFVLQDCLASIDEQLAAGAASGIRMGLELHVNSPFETLDQARRLLEERPDIPLVYDATHFVMQGHPIKETGWLMERAVHCHLRDAAQGAIQAPFGQGEVDFDWVLGALKDSGFQGDISIEYLGTQEFDVVDSAKRLYDLLMEWAA